MKTLAENVTQAINDFNSIELAIQSKGQETTGKATSEYAELIRSISGGTEPVKYTSTHTDNIRYEMDNDTTEYEEGQIAYIVNSDNWLYGIYEYTNGIFEEIAVDGTHQPRTYTELEYIQSTGTQYIDTGVEMGSNIGIDITFDTTKGTNYQAIYGGRDGTNSYYFLNNVRLDYSVKELAFARTMNKPTLSFETNETKVTIKSSNGVTVISDTKGHTYTDTISYGSFTSNLNFLIMAFNDYGNANNIGTMKLYELKLYDNDELIIDAIPIKDKNDVVCLYDKINNEYIYNAGKGNFIAGPEK